MSRKHVSVAQESLGAVVGHAGNGAGEPPPESVRPHRAVTRPDVTASYVGPGHGMFLELLTRVERGQRVVRMDRCKRGHEAPHEYVCVQPRGPRVWHMTCTRCRRERLDMEAGR